MKRFAITKVQHDGLRVLAHPAQARYMCDTREAAEAKLKAILNPETNSADTLKQVYGDVGKMRVDEVECYLSGDPRGSVVGFDGPPEITPVRPELTYDGRGVNGPDYYRTRVATFQNTRDGRKYGELFAASPDMLRHLKRVTEELAELIKDERDDRSVGITGWDALHQSVGEARDLIKRLS